MSDFRIFIGLGGNLGNPKESFSKAMKLLSESGCTLIQKSSLYRTKPYGFSDQPDFLNAVLEIRTAKSPIDLLKTLQGIENELGKKVVRENGPRLIDMDLLIYGDQVINERELTVPHPGVGSRDFVLLPLCEFASEYVHPTSGRKLEQHLSEISEIYASGERESW